VVGYRIFADRFREVLAESRSPEYAAALDPPPPVIGVPSLGFYDVLEALQQKALYKELMKYEISPKYVIIFASKAYKKFNVVSTINFTSNAHIDD
jgi:hypothetical protein